MAWVKVVKRFRDKNTRKIHEVGERMNIPKERISEILEKGKFIELDQKKKTREGETAV
ncbi:MAG: hypothetical protein MJ117_00190 [Lachnospiraceae bacterium]|nr:hypothetical protein [Lachnospiraceae bacterium]